MSQTVARAMEIVRFVAAEPRSLTEVAEHLQVHKSTALRLLQTLEENGFVRLGSGRRYKIGFELIALGQLALDQVEVRKIAHDALGRLAEEYGHTVHLGELVGDSVVYIDKVDSSSRRSVVISSRIGLTAVSHTAGVAKVIVAFQDEPTFSRIIDSATLTRYTSTTIMTREGLREELMATRSRGWAEDNGEQESFINCVALPIFSQSGEVKYGISISALRDIASLELLREHLPVFRRAALEISEKLGWREAGATAVTG